MDSPTVQRTPHAVNFIRPLGRGKEVVSVMFTTSTPRILVYHEVDGTRHPISVSVEDLAMYIDEARRLFGQIQT